MSNVNWLEFKNFYPLFHHASLALSQQLAQLCLPQLASEWKNHAFTPREPRGSTPSAEKPIFPFGGVLVTQRVTAQNAFAHGSRIRFWLCVVRFPSPLTPKVHCCYIRRPLLMTSAEILVHNWKKKKIVPL